jgi:flavin reductase (DIM6/NTAB) family NADH-FMN oxidoreductase RutF
MSVEMKKICTENKSDFEKRVWIKMINSLSGFKSANLVGTISKEGVTNAAMISSVVHLGANPPLMGFILRPNSKESPRHTYLNILDTGFFTINHVTKDLYKKAHQTSARYPKEVSEFEMTGLETEQTDFKAPYLKEALVRIGLKHLNTYDIKENNTHLVVGEIVEFYAPKSSFYVDGHIDIESPGSLALTGLDSYHETKLLSRLNYAKPDIEVHEISADKMHP